MQLVGEITTEQDRKFLPTKSFFNATGLIGPAEFDCMEVGFEISRMFVRTNKVLQVQETWLKLSRSSYVLEP
jgi:hypothetical protein